MTDKVNSKNENLITVLLYLVIACVLVVAIFLAFSKFMAIGSPAGSAGAPMKSVLVFAPDQWVAETDVTDADFKVAFQKAFSVAEKARDAGYIVLFNESVMLAPESVMLTPAAATVMGLIE